MRYFYLVAVLLIIAIVGLLLKRTFLLRSEIKSLNEFYNHVDEFVQRLRSAGCHSIAEQIDKAMLSGSVGSEIVGDIGLALDEVMRELPEELVPKAKELRHFARYHREILRLR
jgi:hypothetical protein